MNFLKKSAIVAIALFSLSACGEEARETSIAPVSDISAARITNVDIEPDSLTLLPDSVGDFDVVMDKNMPVRWSSGDTSVATVNNKTGFVTAVTPGRTEVEAKAGPVRDHAPVIVEEPEVVDDTTPTDTTPPNEPPVASIVASSDSVAVGDTVAFDGSGSSDPDGSVASYAWTFGDGDSGSGATVEHVYADSGTYEPVLIVTDDDGATDADTALIEVVAVVDTVDGDTTTTDPDPDPAPEPDGDLTGPGAHQPSGSAHVWDLDTSQADQDAHNPDQPAVFVGTRWTNPETDPDYGAFFAAVDSAMEFRWKDGADDGRAALLTIRDFHTEPLDAMYVRLVFRFSENWQPHGSGTTKLINWEGEGGGNFTFNVNDQTGAGGGLALHNIPDDEAVIWETADKTLIQVGTWYDLELVIYRESSVGADDGRIDVFLNGVEVTGWDQVPLGIRSERLDSVTWFSGSRPGWDAQKIGPYWGGSGSVKDLGAGAHDAIRFRELYVSGVPMGATEEPVEEEPTDPSVAVFADDFDGGLAADQNGYGWGLQGGALGVNYGVVSGAGRGGSDALVLTHPAKPKGEDSVAQINFHLGAKLTEVWCEYWLRVPDNYFHREDGAVNNKWWQVWGGDRSNETAGLIAELEASKAGTFPGESNLKLIPLDNVKADGGKFPPVWDAVDPLIAFEDRGRWMHWRWHVRLGTPGLENTDGTVELWLDGKLVFSRSDLHVRAATAEGNYLHEGRIGGWANSGWDEETRFVFDEFRIYTSDPGW